MLHKSGKNVLHLKKGSINNNPKIEIYIPIPPYILGKIGGEMTKRMVETAEIFLSEQAALHVRKNFQNVIKSELNPNLSGGENPK